MTKDNNPDTDPARDEAAEILRQSAIRTAIANEGTGPWTTIWETWRSNEDKSGARFAAFALPSHRARALGGAGWDLRMGHGRPGFSQSFAGETTVTTYERYTHGGQVVPIVIRQEMHGAEEDSFLLSEEFRLLMDLWEDRATGNYYSFDDDGSKQIAVEFIDGHRKIRIRTPILRRYQAARQLDLLLFTESIVRVKGYRREDFADVEEKDHLVNEDTVIFVGIGDGMATNEVFSRLMTTRVLTPPPQEESGVWPWELPDDNFPEFIIGEDVNGKAVKFSCNPDRTANYFGANPDAPNYLTPVFFRKEVLQRYYDDAEHYSVEDGYLRYGGLWGLRMDNHNPQTIMVFLGDLGRDLPSSQRDYWKSFNIPPTHAMSETTYRRAFLAEFADSTNPEHVFRSAYSQVRKEWPESWGWDLYREPVGSDSNLLKRARIPLNEGDAEFEGQILVICKLLVDLLNESKIASKLPPVEKEQGLGKLERFLRANEYEYTERDLRFLRRLQALRSKTAAHSKGSTFEKYLASELEGGTRSELITELMRDAIQMLDSFSTFTPKQ
jgi:hypothetical protein